MQDSPFQFQNGTIKSAEDKRIKAVTNCFNSKMVRLKGRRTPATEIGISGFNSKMVRLKDAGMGTGCSPGLVSIPKWYD